MKSKADNNSNDNQQHHSSFPHLWQVKCTLQPQKQKPANVKDEQAALVAAAELSRSTNPREEYGPSLLLLEGQVIHGKAIGTAWIMITAANGGYIPRTMMTPYWPLYRVVGSTHQELRGVAPYVVRDASWPLDKTPRSYDPHSSFVEKSLSKSIGHVFESPESAYVGGGQGVWGDDDDPTSSNNWWTNDGIVWWPKTVPMLQKFGIPLPRQGCCGLFPLQETVTEWAAPLPGWYTTYAFGGNRAYWIVAMILAEYIMIPIGVYAGVNHFGWSVQLQLVYMSCLIVLVLCEIASIAILMPNGVFWLRLNTMKIPMAMIESVLWRWDLYSDVGFVMLAYRQRARTSAPLWVYALVLTAIVTGGRLTYTFAYVKKLIKGQDETILAKISIPAFMTVYQLLCQGIHSDEGREARRINATTRLGFELLRSFVEDFPEIAIQSAYLYGGGGPPVCFGCEYGFVFISLLVSIATSMPGLNRIYQSYQRYRNVSSELDDARASRVATFFGHTFPGSHVLRANGSDGSVEA